LLQAARFRGAILTHGYIMPRSGTGGDGAHALIG
jgi:hypothetical protein